MQIYYDSKYTDELTEKITKKFLGEIEKRDKVHLSDLCHCPVKVWCRLNNIVPLINEGSMGIMMIGMVGQEIMQGLYPPEQREYEPDKNLPEEEQLPSHIDIFAELKTPVEIKWSRKAMYRGSDVSEYKPWVLQITGYMAKTNSVEGKIAIFNVISGKLNAFKIIMTEDELRQRREEIVELKKRIESNNIDVLEPWFEECKYCDYRPSRKRKKAELEPCPKYNNTISSVTEEPQENP